MNPLTKFLRDDVRDLKVPKLLRDQQIICQNQKREFTRAQEKYEELVSRYSAQSRSKDASVIRDVARLPFHPNLISGSQCVVQCANGVSPYGNFL